MNRKQVASSNIRSIGFEEGKMHIEFASGRVYEYTGPRVQQHYEGMLKAESAGKYFSAHVRSDPHTKARAL